MKTTLLTRYRAAMDRDRELRARLWRQVRLLKRIARQMEARNADR